MMSKNKILFSVLSASLLTGTGAFANTNPAAALITVYGVAISSNADCSNASVIGYNQAGNVLDFSKGPSITNAGIINPGSYPCVILYMSDVVTFTPAANDGANCVAGTSYSQSICNLSNSCHYTTASPDASNTLVYGALKTPLAADSLDVTHSDKVLLFLSTGSTGTGNNAFQQPVAGSMTNGIHLNNPFVVSDTGGAGTFVVNFNGRVNGSSGSSCGLDAPTFDFR